MLKKKLQGDLKDALKNKEKLKLDTVRLLIAALQYEEIQKKSESLPEEVCNALLQREINKRREELEFADHSGRPELKDKLLSEISIIEAYLPKQLSSVELERIISDLKLENPALNLGVAMKALKDNYNGQYDGKIASQVARKILG